MFITKKIMMFVLVGLLSACSANNMASTAHKCCHHAQENCCKDGCDKCQKCAQTNCECLQCQSGHENAHSGATDLLLNKKHDAIKCDHHK